MDFSILQLIPAPEGTQAVVREENNQATLVSVLAFALCEVTERKETSQQICGVFAGDGLDLCEEVFGAALCFYLAPGEKLTASLKRLHKLK